MSFQSLYLMVILGMIITICILIGILYVNMPILQSAVRRKLIKFIEKIEKATAWINDYDDEYDAEWMDREKWEKTRLRRE